MWVAVCAGASTVVTYTATQLQIYIWCARPAARARREKEGSMERGLRDTCVSVGMTIGMEKDWAQDDR